VLKNPRLKDVPGVYILTVDPGKKANEDTFFIFAERARQRQWKYIEMIADHNPQWSKPGDLVSLLEGNQ
jgi:hypothetical protein